MKRRDVVLSVALGVFLGALITVATLAGVALLLESWPSGAGDAATRLDSHDSPEAGQYDPEKRYDIVLGGSDEPFVLENCQIVGDAPPPDTESPFGWLVFGDLVVRLPDGRLAYISRHEIAAFVEAAAAKE